MCLWVLVGGICHLLWEYGAVLIHIKGHWPYALGLALFITASVVGLILEIMAQGPVVQAPTSYLNAPSYVEASSFSDKEVLYTADANSDKTQSSTFSTSFIDFKPVAIPQLDDLWYGGPNVSPFVRAYPPELVHHGIAEQDFMDFMDGLNEAWLINPAMNYFGIATGVAGVFSGPARFHSIGPISWAATASSIPVSIARTKTYLKTWNKKLFNPVGLEVKVLKTDALMSALGHSGENVWEEYARHATKYEHVERELCNRATGGENSPENIKADAIKLIQKRMEPLAPYVSPLSFDVPPPKELEGGWMKKWEGKEAQRMEYSHMKRLQHTKEKQLKKSMDKEHKDRERVTNLYSEIQATQDALDSPTETHHKEKIKHLADMEQKLKKLYVEIDEDTEVRFEERVKKSG